MDAKINQRTNETQEEEFKLSEYLLACLAKWQWFVFSVIIFVCIGFLYILRQQPVYSRTMSVLVKSGDSGMGALDMMSAFSNFGFGGGNTQVNNELIAMTSPAVMAQVVDNLKLTVNYAALGTFHPTTLYGTKCPVEVEFPDMPVEQGGKFKMDLKPDGTFKLYDFETKVDQEKIKYDDEITGKLGFQPIKSPFGKIFVKPSAKFTGKLDEELEMRITRSGFQSTVETYVDRLNSDLADQDADVIDLTIKDVSIERAVDVLNDVVMVYNQEWMNDKNKISVATNKFIDDRLADLERELSMVDVDISDFRSANLMTSVDQASKAYLEGLAKTDENKLMLENQIALCQYFLDYLENPTHKNDVLPMNLGFDHLNLANEIGEYNALVIARDGMLQKTSASNPLIKQYDEQIATMRDAIYKSVVSAKASFTSAIKNFQSSRDAQDSKFSELPTQARELLSVERKQKVMEELYLFLLQKREETELSQTFSPDNTRIITPPYGSLKPVAPKKAFILFACFCLGLAFPGVLVYYITMNDNKVRSRRDLDNLTIPFAGEIPFVGKKDSKVAKLFRSKKANKKMAERPKAIIEPGKRDVSNEAFRVVRSNLEFMFGKDKGCKVIMLTSFNPGSGKSFIAFNLGLSFGLKDQRVLMIDCDLRHASLSTYVNSPKKGIVNFLTGETDDWKSLLVNANDKGNVKVLPLGPTPPNPAELLENGRLGELVEQARNDFDYIILDCPPTEIVVDTQIVERYVDRTVFIVRAGLLDKRALEDIEEIYENQKFKHLSLILNGTDSEHSRYYNYGTYEGVTPDR